VFVLVAIHALRKLQRLLEIAAQVTRNALGGLVLAEQREPRFGMVERLIQARTDDALPTGCRVAGLAGLLREAAFVGVAVAVVAFRKWQADVTWLIVGTGGVALLAFHLRVLTCERIARLGVIERGCDIFPTVEVVTGSTVRAEASGVRIFVARGAGLG